MRVLRREVHAAQQILEARVGAQEVEGRVGPVGHQPGITLFIGSLQPGECLTQLAQGSVDQS